MCKLLSLLTLGLATAGCMSTTPLEVTDWPLEPASRAAVSEQPKFGPVRLSGVFVHAPYDVRSLAVMRANGSLAFDDYNRFAAAPSQLVRQPALQLLEESGLFQSVIPAPSLAPATLSVELEVSRLALDCRTGGARTATVRLVLRFVDRTKGLVACVRGEGTADAASGNYGAAFSEAFASAFATALGQIQR